MSKKFNIHEMTQSDFHALPSREWDEDIGEFNALVILPTRRRYDKGSQWGCMDFIACTGSEPIIRLSGCSDVLHIGGIGGMGKFDGNEWPDRLKTISWSIDLLFKSKLLRLYSDSKLTCGAALSSFDIYSKGKNK